MLLTYVDESYTDEWFTMAALLVDGPAAIALAGQLDAIAADAAKTWKLDPPVELHGYEIMQGIGQWRKIPLRARIGIFSSVVHSIAAQDVQIIARAMDVIGQGVRYTEPDVPHSVVLRHILERVDECVDSRDEYALVIADEIDNQTKYRGELAGYQVTGTAGYRHRRLTRIVDTLHFAPSDMSRLVQAVDVVAYLFRRTFTHHDADLRARRAKVALWQKLEPRVLHSHCWFPVKTSGRSAQWGRDIP